MDIFHMISVSHFESQFTVIVMVDHADNFDTIQVTEPGWPQQSLHRSVGNDKAHVLQGGVLQHVVDPERGGK